MDLIKADAPLTAELLQQSPDLGRHDGISNSAQLCRHCVHERGFLHTAFGIDLLRQIWRHSLACGILWDELSQASSTNRTREARATLGLLSLKKQLFFRLRDKVAHTIRDERR